ncbi:alkaline phosphatase [Paenibacillus tarimensis]|uniref:alkaline phosphatase n=1 Tax=Paenibacillus tarimensis TaxID=416012 RepID=UPI001F451C54|nr:alkaline phosphatase [Paenibacillus tarimensis]MCF2945146.1 alkaline phosphatase [Paenibacillus tarimensis]
MESGDTRRELYNKLVSRRLSVGWTGSGHTDSDVGIWAYGAIAPLVTGTIENTQIARSAVQVLDVNLDDAARHLQSREIYYPAEAVAEALQLNMNFADLEAEGVYHDEQFYLPLAVFQEHTGKLLEWDSLSERIVITG